MEANESSRVSDDLTSTAESVLTNNGHEKKINHSDSISVGDSTPSSSSDANMQTSIVKTIHDDPISSTSDSLIHENEMNLNILTSDLNFIAGVETSGSTNDIGTDSDFFTSELSIASMATEKISEDVEDIANDLENLLGETTHSYGVICTNSVVVTNTSERLKEISTSSASISGNLFIDQAEIDIAGEVISQVEISSDNLEGKNQVLASKDAHFCINSDVLEANKKTECTVEYSSVDILNSDGEVTHTEVSRFTQVEDFSQSAYSSKEANDEGNALSVGQLDLNIANIETDSLQKEGEEEISADKDLNEETDRNQKISENKPNSTQTLVTNEEDENALVPGKASSEVLRECEVDVFQEMIGVDKKDASNVDNAETIDDNELKTLPAMETLEHIETNKEVQEAEMDLMETGDENVMGVGENIEDTTPTTLMVEEKNCELEFSSNQAQVEDESSERVVDNVDAVVFNTVEQVIAENDATQSEFYKQQTLIELQDDNMENITTSKSADKIIDEESAMEVTEAVEFMETEEILQPDEQKGVDETDIPQTHEERKEECEVIQQEASGREEGEVNPLEGTSSNVSSAISPRENLSQPDEEHESKDTVVPSETVKDLETSDEVPNLDSNVPVEIKEDIEIAPSGSTPELVEHMEEGNMIVGSDEFTNKEEEEEREKELISTQTEAVMDAENFDAESFNLSTNTEAALSVELDNEDTATNAGQMQGLEDSPRNKSEDAVIEAAVADLSEEVRLTSENVAAPEFQENVASSEEIAVDVPKDDLDETNNSELPVSHQSDIIQTENKCPEETNEGLFVLEIQETAKSENVDMAKCVERNSSDQEAADTLLIKSGEVDVEPLEKNVEVIENLEESNKQMSTNEIDEIVDDKTAEAVNDVEMPLEGDTAELEIKTSTTENNEELTEISEMPETATASERHEEGDDVPSKSKLVDLIQEETLDNDEQICSNTPFTDAILSTEFNEIAETEVNKSEAVCDIQMNEESSLNLESCEVAEIDKVPVELPMDDSNIQDHLNIKEPTTEDKNLDALDATEIVDHDVAKENVEVDNKNDDLIMQESDDASAANAIQEDMQEPDKIMQDEAQENTEEFENKNIEPNVAELEPATEAITLEENTEGNENPDLEEDLEEPKIEPITEDSNEVSEDIAVLPQDDIEMLPDSSIENQTQEPKSDPSIAEIEDVDENLQQTVGGLLDATLPLTPEDPQPTADDIVQPVEQETVDSSTEQTLTFITEDAEIIENIPVQSEQQTNLENQDVMQLQEESYGLNTDESPELQLETSQTVDYSSIENASDEPSELQCAISQIVDDMQPTDNSEVSELQSAISHIIDSPEIMSDSNLTDHTPMPQVDSSEAMDDCQTFELQNAISQIVYSSDSTDDSKSAELQSAICQIIDNSEETEEDSELQNAITQIINTPELETNSKNEEVLEMQIEQHIAEDNLDNKIDQAQSQEETETELKPIEKEVKFDDTEDKINSEVEMQSLYSEPVVDLMLEDMDDQLKHVIFESKSDDSIVNMPTISEVNLDTPKTFESPHIDLILPEETSLLNTDDIISGITPSSQNMEVQPEEGLKISELNRSDSKDLNDVIAREIESLLELQTQELSEDTIGDVSSNITNKIENEEKISGVVLEEKSSREAEKLCEKIQTSATADNYQLSTELAKIPQHSVTEEVMESSNDSRQKNELSGEVDIAEKKMHQKEDIDYNYRDLTRDTSEKSIAEVSSTTVVNIARPINQPVDYQITSTEVQKSRNESVKPLLIEVGAPMEMESNSQLQSNIDISTSNYSSKMSENEDLKMTITKHKIESTSKAEVPATNETHSILKIYDPKDTVDSKKSQKMKEATVPKLIIKPIVKSQSSPTPSAKIEEVERETVPKLFIRNMSPNRPGSPKVVKSQKSEITSPLKLTIKPVLKPEECQSKSSPKLTIKPIVKTDEESSTSGPKITIKPIIKPPEEELCHSPKITIKPIIKPDDCQSEMVHSPRITIKPIPKPDDIKEYATSDVQTSRITIKPVRTEGCNSPEQEMLLKRTADIDGADRSHSPRITIKPILKPEEHKSNLKQDQKSKQDEFKLDKKEGSPKITIKPVVKPVENEGESIELIDFEDQIKQERIVLKINKNSMAKDSRKRDSTEEIEKLAKIKLKFSKEGGHAHIISEQSKLKRALEESIDCDQKRTKFESDDLTITPIDADAKKTEKVIDIIKDDVNITPINPTNRPMFEDPLEKIPIFEITPESAVIMKSTIPTTVQQVTAPTPRKRGRPRKVPLVVREEFKDVKEEEILQQQEQPAPEDTGRPKRSCRGPSVRTTLGIRTRKPRGSGRGRGRGRGARGVGSRGGRQQRVSAAKLKLLKEEAAAAIAEQSQSLEPDYGGDIEMKEEPAVAEDVSSETAEIVLIEEETRMSADINISRAQTPAKQGDNSVPTPGDVEDTQSSVQSTATTESTKGRKGTRTEVHQEPEGEVISADQLTEYYWGGGGPYMLQEQVAQFLGIKSFKRKYPGIQRRTVDMQERDFIRESGLVSEAMCDLGLTAVHSADILDILYSDFQHKYEEYCKHQRDRQAKDFSNKQKALSLAASQEKNKHDIVQQAVQSAASWNTNFNKSRREERKACMDLQTFTIHYPKGRFKNVDRNKTGHYPVALVPGQYTDYYKSFTPTELSNLPINTMLNKPINIPAEDDSPSDGSASDSDSSSSDSDSSSSSSSGDDCNICSPSSSNQTKKVLAN